MKIGTIHAVKGNTETLCGGCLFAGTSLEGSSCFRRGRERLMDSLAKQNEPCGELGVIYILKPQKVKTKA